MTTVVIVDNHRAFGEHLQAFVRDQLRCTVVGVGTDAAAGLELTRKTRPDVALVDVGLPDESGFDLARRVVADQPYVRVVLMGDGEPAEYVRGAAEAGAFAYLPKTAVSQRLAVLLGVGVADAERASHAPLPHLAGISRPGLVVGGALAGGTLAGGLALGQPAAALAGAIAILLLSRWQSARALDRGDGVGARRIRQLRRRR